jgi:hypothetical protein
MRGEACINVGCDDECCTMISEGFRVARKSHKCCECREEIKPGSRYYYEFTTYDGETTAFKTCEICKELRDKLFRGWMWGDIWYEIGEFIRNNPSRSILDCAVGKLSQPALDAYLDEVKRITAEAP